jgi:hypothetical protein
MTLAYFPDREIGWYPYALAAASKVVSAWKPDIIYASATPFTSLLVAGALSRRFGIPWVGELRDLWTDNPYYDFPQWRKALETRLERRVLSDGSGLITVSEPMVEVLESKYHKPTALVLNGFDPPDYPVTGNIPFRDGSIHIVYTGMIYDGRRDPSPLFQALVLLGTLAEQVRIDFYGRYLGAIREANGYNEVKHLVQVHSPVPYRDALQLQSQADVLLLLLWDNVKDRGMYTGKLFEYIGASRPILAIGNQNNVAAQLIRDRVLGAVADRPEEIAEQLRSWIKQKATAGMIPALSDNAGLGLTREAQARICDEFLSKIVR